MPCESTGVELSFERPIAADDLLPLLAQSHWAAGRTRDDVHQMLAATPVILGAWKANRLVGFARALTDGRYRALIDDVIVDASLRGQGVGSHLMQFMADRLAHVEEIFLRCDKEVLPFYESLGYRQTAICLDLVKRQSLDSEESD